MPATTPTSSSTSCCWPCCDALKRKDAPFFVLDTHAGRGRYLLAAPESRKTGEADAGILRLLGASEACPRWCERYLRAVQADNPVGALIAYPGSPLLVAQAHARRRTAWPPANCSRRKRAALKELFAPRRARGRACARRLRGDQGDAAAEAGRTKFARGLVLIDPPYEAQDDEYPQIIAALREAPGALAAGDATRSGTRSSSGAALQPFFRKAAALPGKSVLLRRAAGARRTIRRCA